MKGVFLLLNPPGLCGLSEQLQLAYIPDPSLSLFRQAFCVVPSLTWSCQQGPDGPAGPEQALAIWSPLTEAAWRQNLYKVPEELRGASMCLDGSYPYRSNYSFRITAARHSWRITASKALKAVCGGGRQCEPGATWAQTEDFSLCHWQIMQNPSCFVNGH